MTSDDEDIPVFYLLYVVAMLVAVGVIVIVGFILCLR